MKSFLLMAAVLLLGNAVEAQKSAAGPAVSSLPEVRRVYVDELIGANSEALRALIIASLDSAKLFILTDNPDRADAILKGAADDKAFTETLDIQEGISTRQNAGKSGSGSSSSYSKSGGIYGGLSVSDQQSHHSNERKHEAYAALRLCNKDGDVLWSTTQESPGAKFRGASADVAVKVARQLSFDIEKARRGPSSPVGN